MAKSGRLELQRGNKIWNQMLSSLIEFFSVKCFSNKLNKFLEVVDIDSILTMVVLVCLLYMLISFTV